MGDFEKLDNSRIFGTDDYEEVQKTYENWSLGIRYYYAKAFEDQWQEELQWRKLSGKGSLIVRRFIDSED